MGNVITDVGLGLVTALLAASSHKYLAWGTDDDPAAAVGDTDLNAESAEGRTSGTQSQQTTTTSNDTYRVVGTITATDTRAIVEAGIFSADSGGSLLARSTFAVANLSTGDSIAFTCNIKFDQA